MICDNTRIKDCLKALRLAQKTIAKQYRCEVSTAFSADNVNIRVELDLLVRLLSSVIREFPTLSQCGEAQDIYRKILICHSETFRLGGDIVADTNLMMEKAQQISGPFRDISSL